MGLCRRGYADQATFVFILSSLKDKKMRYLSGFLMVFLGIGCVNAASAETACVVDLFAPDDAHNIVPNFLGGLGLRGLKPVLSITNPE